MCLRASAAALSVKLVAASAAIGEVVPVVKPETASGNFWKRVVFLVT
jgi:hypothetical protein